MCVRVCEGVRARTVSQFGLSVGSDDLILRSQWQPFLLLFRRTLTLHRRGKQLLSGGIHGEVV